MEKRPLPVGVDNFEDMIQKGYYYVDKSLLIKELLDRKGAVNLFTRPRRFGKTLNMSMLQCFFEDTNASDTNRMRRALFSGLKVTEFETICHEHMGKYPVISLSLKSARQSTFAYAFGCMKQVIGAEFARHESILEKIGNEETRNRYCRLRDGLGVMEDYLTALAFLSQCLTKVYGKKTILLIDEYDVPLEASYYNGFYEEMAGFLRSLFESALKTNPYLEFAVITGCLRISKESIFTGLNNLEVISIISESYGEHFGFQQWEVDEMLQYYERTEKRGRIKEWYDGYRFCGENIYNPWSLINYVRALTANADAFPRPYWSNTSSNSIVRDLIQRADLSVKAEIEALMARETIEKPIYEDITYDSIYDSDDHLWNFLLFTGYLKLVSQRMSGRMLLASLAIPNEEVAYIYDTTIRTWFDEEIRIRDLTELYRAMLDGDAESFETQLSALLRQSISYMDSREAFYHGFLLGVLGNLKEYLVRSNRESGSGRPDITICSPDVSKTPVILELKVSDTYKEMDQMCDLALQQIEERAYYDGLAEEGYCGVRMYGIAFFRKQCRIKAGYREW
ncbi:AAA family ATPase [bacterium 1XD42-94]|nr:AAA family ATPase [bacterium 1XD42-76]NBK07077.1 AAA family ATPase [bacterium 1XD42-94]